MIIGDGFKRLEQRVTAALCGGSLNSKEALFLQNILRKIELYRERAFVSSSQASWLFTIITKVEQRPTDSPNARNYKSICAPSRHSSSNETSKRSIRMLAGLDDIVWSEEEKPRGFDLSEAIEPDSSL